MRTYLALTRLSIQRQFTYRAATFAGLMTNFFFGILRASVMIALYAGQPIVAGMTIGGAITYTGLSQASIGYLSLFNWFDIIHSVNNGQIGADLLKPMSFFGFWMAQDFGRALVNILLRGVPIMVFYALVFGITTPEDFSGWLAVIMCLLLSWLVSFTWRFLVNLSAFWSTNAYGLARFFFGLSWLFSGFLMPMRFFPGWFVRLANLTPFPHIINTLVEVYLGLLTGDALVRALLAQAAWALGLAALGQIVLRLGIRKLVIQGG